MKFKNSLGQKAIMKMTFTKNIANISQVWKIKDLVKLENWDFLKKDSQDFKNPFQFGLYLVGLKSKIRSFRFLYS